MKKNFTQSIGAAEATLSMGAASYPIPAIYLHLIAVMDYMRLKKTDLAQEHLLVAWEIARPDDLLEGFGEHHGLLGAMLGAVIKPRWPDDFRRMIDITNHFSKGWRDIAWAEYYYFTGQPDKAARAAGPTSPARTWERGCPPA